MVGFGTVAAAGISAGIGGINSHQATKKNRVNRKRFQGVLNNLLGLEAGFGDKQEELLQQRLGRITEGYGQARGEYARTGRATQQNIIDRGEASRSRIEADAVSRGLSSSTTPIQYGAIADSLTSRRLAEVDQRVAGGQAQLLEGQTRAEAGVLGELSQLYGLRYSRIADIEGRRAQYFGGVQYQPQRGPNLGGLGKGLDGVLDYFDLFQD